MVHIKKVEIFGFKSFGFKNTTVQFERGLVSISGPNGSGKSNILDAVIFAMGENRPKVMRVDKLRSLLHDIEGTRRGPKLARVNVTFDNSDRKIPLDADTVDITREMDNKGENTYYLNKKQTNRSQILDLLDIANAGLNQLNAVQQGTVTRISEFTSEEKRQTIEDLVGLSYFDQKKAESEKQLDEADRRLEIALAKMGEIKKRIDELEEERNQKLRYDILNKEIARFNAIAAADKLKTVRASLQSKQQDYSTITHDITDISKKHQDIRQQITKIETEKQHFMSQADQYNQAKADIDTQISAAIQQYDEFNSATITAQKRISHIDSRIPDITATIADLDKKREQLSTDIETIQDTLKQIETKNQELVPQITQCDTERDNTLSQQSEIAKRKSETDQKIQLLTDKLNEASLSISKLKSKQHDLDQKIGQTTKTRQEYILESARFSKLLSRYQARIQNHNDTLRELHMTLENHTQRRAKILREIDETTTFLESSTKKSTQHETKLRLVKDSMHEDYSIAKLQGTEKQLGIDGLVYQKISWDKKYERAILAAGAEWIKAFVVSDFATLIRLAEVARHKKLHKLKIIPMEALSDFEIAIPSDPGILGLLSDFVTATIPKYHKLKAFLFGGTILVDSRESAYRVSKAGYKSVTLDGELFEAKASAVVVDINSKISHLTKIITLGSSVDDLLRSINMLKKLVIKNKYQLKKIEDIIASTQDRFILSQKELASTTQSYTDLKLKADSVSEMLHVFDKRLADYNTRQSTIKNDVTQQTSITESLRAEINSAKQDSYQDQQSKIADRLEQLNLQKSKLEKARTEILHDQNHNSTRLSTAKSSHVFITTQITNLDGEITSFQEERTELESSIRQSVVKKEQAQQKLVGLRQKEQELVTTSGTSVSEIQTYDEQLRALNNQDKSFTKQINILERNSDSLSRDIAELKESARNLSKILDSFGLDPDTETFDVSHLIKALQSEVNTLTALNAKAPETFVEVSTGYRSMSTRKNSLEEERNSIVRFIEEIEKDKRQTFLDAFDQVDKEIRHIFNKMTGGNAWLELQNEDDIFASGISYLIQFPNKQKRESTSISGGEKTLAAIVFVLALQKLKPSPFYLFDEVDAHLDAPNSERLSKILDERAEQSQFIMVSLKDSVVQKAKLIYGVFPKNGVSHVVTYKDKRVPKMLNE